MLLNHRTKQPKKVLVGLSGGVDSSVAASLLLDQGFAVEGAYMRCWSDGPYCSAERDQADAARVASMLGIPFQVLNFEKEYKEKVIDYFYAEYEAGRTPNPDVMCNKEIKFGLFLSQAISMGFDYVATGHYARVEKGKLLKGADSSKDQSYFLYLVKSNQLEKVLFPLGNLEKKEVRKIASRLNLPTANKPDSTGICFVGPAPIKEFLSQKIKTSQGDIVSLEGKVLGKHKGLAFYTIGQREGIGVSASIPYYVVRKDPAKNQLLVAPFGHKSLFSERFLANSISWVGKEPQFPKKAEVKLRYRAENVPVEIIKNKEGVLEARLERSERAITPGQSAVFYVGNEVLGGAVVDKVLN